MKKSVILILFVAFIALFIAGCDVVIECQDVIECEGKPHSLCNGSWSCLENKCIYNCPGDLFNVSQEEVETPEEVIEDNGDLISEIVVNITSIEDEEELDIDDIVVNETNEIPEPVPVKWESSGEMTVSFIDVGYGDSILIITPKNKSILIDGGEDGMGSTVVNYLRKYGVYLYLDVLIASNSGVEHVGGVDAVLYNMLKEHVVKVYDLGYEVDTSAYDGYKGWAGIEQRKKIFLDTKIEVDDSIELQFYSPIEKGYFRTIEDNSLILKVTYHNVSFLFTGDCGQLCEEKIINKDLDADILKVANHGHANATSQEFLNKVTPEIAVISTGDHYHHDTPHAELIERLENKNIRIYRTDEDGDVVIKTDGVSYSIFTEKE